MPYDIVCSYDWLLLEEKLSSKARLMRCYTFFFTSSVVPFAGGRLKPTPTISFVCA